MLLTHAYALWAANVLLAVFAPAFPLSFHDRKFARKPPVPIASVVMGQCKKQEDNVFVWKVFDELSAFRHEKTFRFWQTFDFGQLLRADNSSQILKERIWLLTFMTINLND